eukprot:CAMPEP_0182432378 /NCGR_PEP_ID=MMETSP1167-20130531/55903_1 /TAXON_ID=2988 /ORGANISM="Mallomonas Sp, Strain CCMP3275" /LENGTH=215 /DNA_ID=CAMNT_0024619811 /DNA_START=172 /DNA_END=819 /DNA_ORIENTATION=-
MAAVLSILQLGYNVVFCDVDIAIVRDPMPYFRYPNADYMHSHNLICPRGDEWRFRTTPDEGNTGFYYVRSNERTIKLWHHALGNISKYPALDDQSIFWIVLRGSMNPPVLPLLSCQDSLSLSPTHNSSLIGSYLVSCPLDGCVFSAGALRGVAYIMLRDGLKRKKEKACTLHANYLKGNERKKSALAIHGYWLASKAPDGTWNGPCQRYVPKLPL